MTAIADNQVHLWCVYDQKITDPNLLQKYSELLNEEEVLRWKRFKFPVHQQQFLITRALVRTILAQCLDELNPAKLEFTKNEYGKPDLGGNYANSSIKFNVSHTNGLVVLAVTKGRDIGVDVESQTRQAEIHKLAKRYFSPTETQALFLLDESEQQARFFDLWTLKEAYIKACGKGLAIPLDSFSFLFEKSSIGIEFITGKDDNAEHWQFHQLAINQPYKMSLALNDNNPSFPDIVLDTFLFEGTPLQGFDEIS